MENLTVTPNSHDFSAVREAMRRHVDQDILPGVSYALLRGRELVELQCLGRADKEADIALRPDHVFRAFSNTKLITSCAVLLLLEDGRLQLDDPIERYIPQLANRRVLRRGATSLDDVEPASGPVTIRHLMTHTSGLSYGVFDPGSLLFKAYNDRSVLNPGTPLSDMIDQLADLPLAFDPGSAWEYSVATDVLGRLVEIVSGQGFDAFVQSRILDPLGMEDTGFFLPEAKHDRLVAYYRGADLMDPTKPGLKRLEGAPYPGAYLKPAPRLSGGGGMVTTLPDMISLVRSLLPGGFMLLKPETVAQMMTNQLRPDQCISFSMLGPMPGKGFGLAGTVMAQPSPLDPPASTGELQWGGVAGTHWWINPRTNLSGVLMTQRYMAFWNPFFFEFKQLAYEAVGAV